MKKNMFLVAVASLMLAGCGSTSLGTLGSAVLNDVVNGQTSATGTTTTTTATGSVLSDVLSTAANGQTVGNVLQSVLGLDKMTEKDLVGSWTYSSPGCAFTSQQLLAQAGGEVVAAQIKAKMEPTFNTVGIKSSNTNVTFNSDKTFTAKFAGKSLSGTYTYDAATSKVTMSTLLLNINCYAKKNSTGISLLFESSKLLTLLQTLSALSGNSTAQTIGDLSSNYDGLRMGFDFKK